MFSSVRGGATGLGSIVAVAVVVALYLACAGAMVQSYWAGGAARAAPGCQLVCAKVTAGHRG